jgi:glutathione S-transferase
MWILRSSDASPFGRKAKMTAALCGLSGRMRVEETDTRDPSDTIRRQNPLGKIPTLILDDGVAIFDSRVIVEFLDTQAGGGIVIPRGGDRFAALTMQALADGILDAALLQVYEKRWRSADIQHGPWLDHQAGKVERGMAIFEANPPVLSGHPHIGQITVACMLGYLDLRFEGKWRDNYPKLVAWLDGFTAAVPAFDATRPH